MVTKIGIIGSGPVAQTLASGFIKHGYKVLIGSREVSKLKQWHERAGADAQVGSFEDAAQYGDLIVLAVKGAVAQELIRQVAPYLKGKIVIDTTNPIAPVPPENGVLKFFTSLDESLMEILQQTAPEARFVKAFSIIGNARMVNPVFAEGKPTMTICGNDPSAKKEVGNILDQFGFDIADMGGIEAARAIEPLCILWCIPGFLQNNWTHAFRILKN